MEFVVAQARGRVLFGAGTVSWLAREIDALGASRALIVCTPGRRAVAEEIANALGPLSAGVFGDAEEHVPEECAARGRASARKAGVDAVIAVGGGSAIGLAKAIALECDVRVIALPTTYSGSEMTSIYGLTAGAEKRTGRDERVRPVLVVYDPNLSRDLPLGISVASGFNAIAHCVEALYAKHVDPLTEHAAEEGIAKMARALGALRAQPADSKAREEALYGAYLGGVALRAGVALHHKLCHVLGGFGLPHAETHTVILPHAARYNESAAPAALSRVARALGAEDGPGALFDLAESVGAPTRLASLGLRESDLERAADLALLSPYENPRRLDKSAILSLLTKAYRGRRP